MFASNTIAAHIVRGVIAAALIAWALLHQSSRRSPSRQAWWPWPP